MILVNACPTCSGTGWTRTPLARSTDPDTSQQAARRQDAEVRRIVIGTKRANVLESFLSHPRTAQEAAVWVHRHDATIANIEGTRRRVSDLVRAGYLLDSGVRRENPGAGTPSIVWQITGKGVRVLNEAHEAHMAKQS
jgi:hypothetical protein